MYTDADDPSTVDVENECSPQNWSKDPNIIKKHLRITISESKRVRQVYTDSRFNVPYGPSPMESYDIYFKGEESGKPILIYFHGGFWQMGTKEVSSYCVAPLVENGYKVIVIDYNLCPTVSLETIIEQLKTGMEKILQYAHESGAKEVTLCGHSAGGHLVSTFLDTDFTRKSLIKHFVIISGGYDLTEIWKTRSCSSISGVENPLGLDEASARKLSPIYYDNFVKFSAEIHLLLGELEAPTLLGMNKVFEELLREQGFKVTRHVFPDYDHFATAHSLKEVDSEVTKYLFNILGLSVKNKL